MGAVLKSKPVKERVSQEEWNLRVDLAAAYQLAAIFKWTDLIYTHFSARLPDHEEFLINPYGLMFEEITASNLIKIDHDGKVIDDPLGLGYNEAGFVIHGCVHEARPEAALGHVALHDLRLVRLRRAVEAVQIDDAHRSAAASRSSSFWWMPPKPPFDMTST